MLIKMSVFFYIITVGYVTKIHDLSVSNELLNFINNELLKDTKVSSEKFWEGFSNVVHELAP